MIGTFGIAALWWVLGQGSFIPWGIPPDNLLAQQADQALEMAQPLRPQQGTMVEFAGSDGYARCETSDGVVHDGRCPPERPREAPDVPAQPNSRSLGDGDYGHCHGAMIYENGQEWCVKEHSCDFDKRRVLIGPDGYGKWWCHLPQQ